MGKSKIEKERKPFKSPSDYNRTFLYYGFLLAIGGIAEFAAFYWTEDDINEFINDNSGNSEDKFIKSILRVIVKFWGKPGFVIATSCICIMISYEICTGIAEYKRYKKKLKLLQEGVIKNVYDIRDDYVSPTLWQLMKRLFTRKKKTGAAKYPSNREMKEQIRRFEKSIKENRDNR